MLEDNIQPLDHVSASDVMALLRAHPRIGFNFASIDAEGGRFRLSVDAQLADQQWEGN